MNDQERDRRTSRARLIAEGKLTRSHSVHANTIYANENAKIDPRRREEFR
jgi:hypothetical protein